MACYPLAFKTNRLKPPCFENSYLHFFARPFPILFNAYLPECYKIEIGTTRPSYGKLWGLNPILGLTQEEIKNWFRWNHYYGSPLNDFGYTYIVFFACRPLVFYLLPWRKSVWFLRNDVLTFCLPIL